MPRKPTRSGNESRPTRRNLSRRVESLDEELDVDDTDLPPLTLADVLGDGPAPELVDEERRIYRVDGELKGGRSSDDGPDLATVLGRSSADETDGGS